MTDYYGTLIETAAINRAVELVKHLNEVEVDADPCKVVILDEGVLVPATIFVAFPPDDDYR